MRLLPLALVGIAAAAAGPARAENLAVDPVVLLDKGAVAACGVKYLIGSASPLTIEVLLQRAGAEPKVTARASGPGKIDAVRIGTASLTLGDFLVPVAASGDEARAEASARDERATHLMRDLMVSGARVEIDAGGKTRAYTLLGPVRPSVRSAYLNCAGDLYRPGE